MSKRLNALAALIKNGRGLIDVGTDHGLLPVLLAQRGYPGTLFASDIHPGPLAAARRTAEAAGLAERIGFLLCDGLSLCPPDAVDSIVIAGMGGDMIVRILDEAEWCMDSRYQLLLQPASKPEILRYWLVNNGFSIRRERLLEEGGILYQILSVGFGGKTDLSDAELFVGKRSLADDELLYSGQLRRVRRRFEAAAAGMERAGETPRLALFREILMQLYGLEGQA